MNNIKFLTIEQKEQIKRDMVSKTNSISSELASAMIECTISKVELELYKNNK